MAARRMNLFHFFPVLSTISFQNSIPSNLSVRFQSVHNLEEKKKIPTVWKGIDSWDTFAAILRFLFFGYDTNGPCAKAAAVTSPSVSLTWLSPKLSTCFYAPVRANGDRGGGLPRNGLATVYHAKISASGVEIQCSKD